jgi:hypothetical protein
VKKRAFVLSAFLGLLAHKDASATEVLEPKLNLESRSTSNTHSCNQVMKQLEMMNLAQKSILDSMLKKNEVLASTLDHYANDFERRDQKILHSDLLSLRNSAKAFRKHEAREQKLVNKFEEQAAQLITKVNVCLDVSSSRSELRQSSEEPSSR